MASDQGTRRRFVLLLVLATIATAGGFYLLLSGETGYGGAALAVGALASGSVLLDTRRRGSR